MKILITGASGFLGRHLYDFFETSGHTVDTLGRKNLDTFTADISKEILPIDVRYDLVIHSAAKAHVVPKTEEEKNDFFAINYKGTRNILRSLTETPKNFTFISTVSVYGLDFGLDISEEHPLASKEPYGLSKIKAEKAVLDWGIKHGVNVTILRLPLLFGKNPPGNLKAMIKAIKKGYYFNIGKGQAKKSMVFAADVAEFIPVIMPYGGIYNLTDGYHPSFKELSDTIAEYYGFRKPISLPRFVVNLMAKFGEIIQQLTKKNMPINKRQYGKMVKSLIINDDKARAKGWTPKSILNYPNKWL